MTQVGAMQAAKLGQLFLAPSMLIPQLTDPASEGPLKIFNVQFLELAYLPSRGAT
jgi:hypothetical protein